MAGDNVFGRGRGMMPCTPIAAPGRGRGGFLFIPDSSTPGPDPALSTDGSCGVTCVDVAHASKLDDSHGSEEFLAGMASKIGLSIGESIASCIESRLNCVVGASVQGSSSNAAPDASLVNVVVRSEIKEPVSFKGDGSDTLTVWEWEAIMMSYMRKKGLPVAKQAEEVLSKLVGRAHEVVRVGVRSKPSVLLSAGPDPIFEILKEHFSDTVCTGMPLADFYATLPNAGEHSFDYWLRLNRAMEVTEDCLRRQNKTFDNLTRDLTAMFIRHCPNPELSLIFKCKPLQQWTACEVHEKLVEHSRNQRLSVQPKRVTTITSKLQEVSPRVHHVTPEYKITSPSMPGGALAKDPQVEGSADRLDRIIAMLEQVLTQRPQQTRRVDGPALQTRRSQAAVVRPPVICLICGNVGHDTHSHCRANRLCFGCFAPNHTRAECPGAQKVDNRFPEPAAKQEEN
ncbi:uncharacterized protein LOC129189766 [Dunckerocampus dactyliophorus]|uniref:uncharacterized protein LOC129189766 n=1 Tax=Dunckerocampus dactyliophorus TaxID=161453 RepID=UPI002404EBF3|nr:uncharacterized protein LOC129189766 [Dunckerocampus dactyliophorus]XP_054647798.1 uncharacterized protein LOC129189766 [Dunckerocampus dactyliophorus]